MDSIAGGSAPEGDDPFRRSSRLSRSPIRGNPVPVAAKEVHTVPQPPIASVRSAVEVDNLPPAAPNTVSNRKSLDLISLPTQRGGTKSPSGSPLRSSDPITELQHVDLRGILTRMSGKINELLSTFETQRHVTRETKSTIIELSALNNRAIVLQEGAAKYALCKSAATQTEAHESRKKAPPKAQERTVQRLKTPKPAPTPDKNVEEDEKSRARNSKPVSYAAVAKEATNGEKWTKIGPKRLRKKPEAIIVKKTGEASYVDILAKIKSDPSLSEYGKHVLTIRRTQKDDLLSQVKGEASTNVPNFRSAIEATLKEMARTGAQRVTVTCSGMDEATTATDLHGCLLSQFQDIMVKPEDVRNLRKMSDGTQTASVLLSANDAITVLKQGKVTVGWSRCRITQDVQPVRCYRCLGYGHKSMNCKETDRTDCCLRCGEQGHKAKGCVAPPKCLICSSETDINHPSGSYACSTYRRYLKEAKSQHNHGSS